MAKTVRNPIDELEDLLIRYKTACYELIPTFVVHALIGLAVIAGGVFVDMMPPGEKPRWLPFGAGTAAALALCLYDAVAIKLEYNKRRRKHPHRAQAILKETLARSRAAKLLATNHAGDRGVAWGKLRIPTQALEKSFLILGNIGSGKTLTFSMLMRDQLPLLVPGSDRRALIYDSQQDFVQILAGMKLGCPMFILNPFDKRHAAWDIANDIDSTLMADTFARHLIPHNPKASTQYFDNAARQVMSAVLQVFIDQAPGMWTFRHLLLVMRSLDRIEQITSKRADTREMLTAMLTNAGDKSRGDIISTIVSETRKYEQIAACWDGNSKTISVKEWLDNGSKIGSAILIMGNYEPARASIDLVNGLFVDLVAKYGLSLPGSKRRRTWLYLDEFAEAGKFEAFKSLVLRGRSKGFVSVVGLQDPRALYSIYGKDDAEAFIKQAGNRAFLHLKSPDAAYWASKCVSGGFASFEGMEEGQNTSRPSLPPQAFLKLPEADFHVGGLEGYFSNGSLGWWHARYSPDDLRALVPQSNEHVAAFKQIERERTILHPWSKADADLFDVPFIEDDHQKSSKGTHAPHPIHEREPIDDVGRIRP